MGEDNVEETLFMIKPDAVRARKIGAILARTASGLIMKKIGRAHV